ncbi:DUF3007 family protein [Synechococcus sp. CS-1325]|uniref:DUF3007 family protein n=1 Tax=unclassified Synechococcus TaxID=2626047 RepID=UPI000DB79CBB|nr:MULTISPECIES: DUF3007 family protein [unclassified Synechococcus]PZV01583.1 MAG: DUF3007 domain-containing protein [Cyanobium sp.]MCT0200290.1 DUF3007 family protein [Synechococcus sp. CS-1325]MCT0214301.1 DUF3007 family protein [Synechococcus sp. CS-1326]MCT0230136.1 DUF3007 family protein [Synechococcus sp. CS-1324]MCT0234465.1 DUF3007 family protein [Synechococcus sp. CS-1327]
MTRGQSLLLGLGVFALGGLGYAGFRLAGFEASSAGIAAEAVLILGVVAWTASYLFRVVTGRMSFMEQRRQYRAAYDQQTTDSLQKQFDALSPADQEALLREIGQLTDDPGKQPAPSP